MDLWMAVTADQYELPVAIETSAQDLAARLGVSKTCIIYRASHPEVRGQKRSGEFRVIRVKVQ